MTPPTPAPRPPLSGVLNSPRTLAAWALLGYVALYEFFEFVLLMIPSGASLADRAAGAGFRSLIVMAMPVLAVLLANYVAPPLRGTRLVNIVAVVEYGVSLTFGLLTLLLGLPAVLDGINDAHSAFSALRYVVMGLAELVLILIAGYLSLRALSGIRAGDPLPNHR